MTGVDQRAAAVGMRGAHVAYARLGASLHCEQVDLHEVEARYGTPTYVYSRLAITSAWQQWTDALAGRPSLVCYAMKANSNLAVLDLIARHGGGFDIVSSGELARVLAAGGDPRRIVFSGVGKRADEIAKALVADILCFNIESSAELDMIEAVALSMGRRARISVRVNPDVDAGTHPYISTGLRDNKFGVAWGDTLAVYQAAARRSSIDVVGIDCHIGSQITTVAPYVDAADRVLDLVERLHDDGIKLRHIDFGGGLGISYGDESPPLPGALMRALLARVDARGHSNKVIMVEPGRSVIGPAGVLLTRVELLKPGMHKNFAIVDAAMNDLMRPAMYQAWMNIESVRNAPAADALTRRFDVVGPVCESGDWLARERDLSLAAGDLLAISGAGAYGMSMASNYNSRPRAAEVIVDGAHMHLVRRRETFEQMLEGESVLPQ